MAWMLKYLRSSLGKKQVMALTGLLLCGFLITHLAGNFLIFRGPESFNSYSHALISNPLIMFAEAGLFLLFLTHIVLAIKVVLENRQARPEPYYMYVPSGHGATFFSRTMPVTGLIILVFLVLHILNFRLGAVYMAEYHGVAMRDLHRLVMETFTSPIYVIWYVFAQVALGCHLAHGFASAFSTLGLQHPKYSPCIKNLGYIFAAAMTIGFSAIPLWAYITQQPG